MQRARFHNKWQYLFIESICNDPAVLEQNYRYKMMYSADYKDVDTNEVRMCDAVMDSWHVDRAVWPACHFYLCQSPLTCSTPKAPHSRPDK